MRGKERRNEREDMRRGDMRVKKIGEESRVKQTRFDERRREERRDGEVGVEWMGGNKYDKEECTSIETKVGEKVRKMAEFCHAVI